MKLTSSLIIGLALVTTTIGTAEARHNNGLDGLLLGSASGALVGHAINRSPEGVLVGSVIGGTIGMLVDLGSYREQVVFVDRRHHGPRTGFVYNNHRDRRHDRWHHRQHRRHDRRWRNERHHHRR